MENQYSARTREVRWLIGPEISHGAPSMFSQWLCSVLRGHYAYFGLPSNFDRIHAFYNETRRLWYRALNRCSQRQLTWARYVRLLERLPLPVPHLTHPRPVPAR